MIARALHQPLEWLPSSRRKVQVLTLITCLTIAASMLVVQKLTEPPSEVVTSAEVNDRQMDFQLQQAAVSALQHREGTIIVIDPRSGRLRTVLNSELAFEKSFAPGSTIKPFTALEAMRSGLADSSTLCRERYSRKDFQTACSHPLHLGPLNTSESIAYSCNYYFARLGERLNEAQFRSLLSDFGFGAKSGINAPHESSGRLLSESWEPQNAIGEGDDLQVTPIQLLMAYSALLNGGELLVPRIADAETFAKHVRRKLEIAENERKVVFEGLRDAVRLGTASKSGLHSLPLNILGKTGTSTPTKGFRMQGWFVGFSAHHENQAIQPTLGVLVFLKKAHGSESAKLAGKIFEEYALIKMAKKPTEEKATTPVVNQSPNTSTRQLEVRVRLDRTQVIASVPLENYILGVVATEGSIETEVEALKALAVASRTYALRNLRRHAAEGFDFCDTTHCQLFSPMTSEIRNVVRNAVNETENLVLRDIRGELAESYFSASCGGETANISTLWNSTPRAYLRGINDEYCTTMPHSHWTDVISTSDLLRAFRGDPRSDVGDELRDVFVSRRDQTGRAEQITIVGPTQRKISGWDFKIIIGRALGWNLLKSSRFRLSRSGSNFVFRGSGFGHGLGMCQEGAHVMAERGFTHRQILAKYFPGTVLGKGGTERKIKYSADLLWSTSTGPTSPSEKGVVARRLGRGRRQLSSEHFRVSVPLSVGHSDAEYLLQLLEDTRRALLSRPALPLRVQLPFIEVFINESTGDFTARTGLPWWAAAGSHLNRIELQPIPVLRRRGILETTLRHELVHKVVDIVGNGRAPRWLAEGLALHLAGEGAMISRYQPKERMSPTEMERKLATMTDAGEMREIYAAAYTEVRNLIRVEGEAAVWQMVSRVN